MTNWSSSSRRIRIISTFCPNEFLTICSNSISVTNTTKRCLMISKNLSWCKLTTNYLTRYKMYPPVKELSLRRDTTLCKTSKLERMGAWQRIEERHSKFGEPGQRRWRVLEALKCWNQSWLKAWSKNHYKAKQCWSEITKSRLRTCSCHQGTGKAILKGVEAWKA